VTFAELFRALDAAGYPESIIDAERCGCAACRDILAEIDAIACPVGMPVYAGLTAADMAGCVCPRYPFPHPVGPDCDLDDIPF
jgi:hypothetical protein